MIVLLSLIKTVFYIITFKLQFPQKYCNKEILMEDGVKFKIFRHMKLKQKENSSIGAIFIVRFKFKKFSHATNIKTSRIPIPLIAGFPGFRDKLWMIDWENGYWQGLYQWDNTDAIEQYKKSFVLGIMNKRSVKTTLTYQIIPNSNIEDYLNKKLIT